MCKKKDSPVVADLLAQDPGVSILRPEDVELLEECWRSMMRHEMHHDIEL